MDQEKKMLRVCSFPFFSLDKCLEISENWWINSYAWLERMAFNLLMK